MGEVGSDTFFILKVHDYESAMLMPVVHLAECTRRESRARVARDETGRVRLSTLLPRALNPRVFPLVRICPYKYEFLDFRTDFFF